MIELEKKSAEHYRRHYITEEMIFMADMPLEQLKQYMGTNPRPEDFDEYWVRALKEADETDVNAEITESDFSVPGIKCMDMYFNGTRGGRVYAKLLIPQNICGKAPAALTFHGYSSGSNEWANYLAAAYMGFVVAAMDCRGQGGRSSDRNPVDGNTFHGHIIRGLDDSDSDNLYFRQVFLDTVILAKTVMAMDIVDENRVAVYGGSQGGGLSLACAALVPEIKIAAVHYPFLADYKRVWQTGMTNGAYAELKDYFRSFDPEHTREEEVFTKLVYIDIQHLADRIKAKVMIGVGLMDDTVPPSAQFAVYNKIKSEKRMAIYPDFKHEPLLGYSDKVYLMLKELI